MSIGKGFIEMGKFLEEHPEVAEHLIYHKNIMFFAKKDSFDAIAKAFGSFEKDVDSAYFMLRKNFGGASLEANFDREEVCERVKVGEKEVPEQILPAQPETVIPAHVEEVYEWKCPESVLGGKP